MQDAAAFLSPKNLHNFYFRAVQLRVRALFDYQAQHSDELSFPKNACITDVQKQDEGW